MPAERSSQALFAARAGFVLGAALVLVGPFALLEIINAPATWGGFPTLLFLFMLGHAAIMVWLLAPVVRRVFQARGLEALGALHWTGAAVGMVLACAFAGVVMDQMPCFMGVPNCD